MKKFFILTVLSSLTLSSAFAKYVGGCNGKAAGRTIELDGAMVNPFRNETGDGVVKVDGLEVARFNGRDMHKNLVTRRFSVSNNHGDHVSGKIEIYTDLHGVIENMTIVGKYNFNNVPVQCWYK